MNYLSICAIFKDEASYMREWLEFHLLVGFQHFFLYNNNSSDNYMAILSPYIDRGYVTLVQWKDQPGQLTAYKDCIRRFKDESKWIAFIDLDEFLYSPQNHIKEQLKAYESYGGVVANWQMFGSGGLKTRPPGLVIESYLQKAAKNHPVNTHVKSIIQPERAVSLRDPHSFSYREPYFAVNEECKVVINAFSPVSIEKFRINHYWSKSAEEGKFKMAKTRASTYVQPPADMWERHESFLNEELDHDILFYVPELKKRLA